MPPNNILWIILPWVLVSIAMLVVGLLLLFRDPGGTDLDDIKLLANETLSWFKNLFG